MDIIKVSIEFYILVYSPLISSSTWSFMSCTWSLSCTVVSFSRVSLYVFFGFFFAGRRPAVAGLLGVLGAPMSGPVSKSAPRGVAPSASCFARASASPSSILPFGKNAHCPAIFASAWWPTDAQNTSTTADSWPYAFRAKIVSNRSMETKRTPYKVVFRTLWLALLLFCRAIARQWCSGVSEGA